MLVCEEVRSHIGGFEMRANWSVNEGARVAVMGPSGAGKSTLLSLIAGFSVPDQGRVMWGGEVLDCAPSRRPVTMIFQDGNLFPHLTAYQNVALGVVATLRLSDAQQTLVHESLEKVGLGSCVDRKPSEMSGGQQARISLARALVRRKPLLLLDEPFGGLGPALAQEMIALVGDLVADIGATLLYVTHAPQEVGALADQVIVVAEGEASAPADARAVLNNPPAALHGYL